MPLPRTLLAACLVVAIPAAATYVPAAQAQTVDAILTKLSTAVAFQASVAE